MQKFLNKIEDMVAESLHGFAAANSGLIRLHEQPFFITRRTSPTADKVALISGGGSGHEPLHIGYVGHGMLDAACPGEIFTSPTPDQILKAAQATDGGAGIIFVVKNYAGDRMNFEMAAEMLKLPYDILVVTDEVVPGGDQQPDDCRRGMAGTVIVEKMVGAAAEAGADLATCRKLGERVNRLTRTIGIAFTSCILPAANKPTFQMEADEMEVGVGIHGEPGRQRLKLAQADDIVAPMVDAICSDLGAKAGTRVLLHVNGFGGTPLLEQHLVYHAAQKCCRAKRLQIVRSLVGNYTTSLEMTGCSITLSILDDELVKLWDAPVCTAALRWGR